MFYLAEFKSQMQQPALNKNLIYHKESRAWKYRYLLLMPTIKRYNYFESHQNKTFTSLGYSQ